MKTIAQFVKDGITDLTDLQDALKTAMRLEFSTIPPYLCAEWSIDSDPDDVSDMIDDVVMQEMYHFALAGNMLTAIKGTPDIANLSFIVKYPTNELPGCIAQTLAVDLQPLTPDQIQVFMQIEYPEFPPVALAVRDAPATIGAFYDTIEDAFTTVKPDIDPNAHFVASGEAIQIKSIQDAVDMIKLIKGEGEGTDGSPDEPSPHDATYAHYYVFKEIFKGQALEKKNGKWGFTGAQIRFPTSFPFKQSTVTPSPSIPFNQALTKLLIDLEACWTSGAPFSSARKDMTALAGLGKDLIKQKIRPEFLWDASGM